MEWGKAVKHEGGVTRVQSVEPAGYSLIFTELRGGKDSIAASTGGEAFGLLYFAKENAALKKAAYRLMVQACEQHYATS